MEIIDNFEKRSVGITLGYKEVPLLTKQEDTYRPVFNTLKIHAQTAVDFALGD